MLDEMVLDSRTRANALVAEEQVSMKMMCIHTRTRGEADGNPIC